MTTSYQNYDSSIFGYDGKTEIYTPKGWVRFDELQDEPVAKVLNDGSILFEDGGEITHFPYAGKTLHFKDGKGRLNLVVTPNQPIVYTNTNGVFKSQLAENSTWFHGKYIKRSASSSIKSSQNLKPHDRFMISFQADGSFPPNISCVSQYTEKGKKIIPLRFHFQKQRKIDRLENILQKCEHPYEILEYPSRAGQKVFDIRVPTNIVITKNFEWVLPSTRTKEWCREFIEEVSYWDATRRTETRYKFDTTNESVAHVVQETAMLADYGCTYSIHTDNRKEHFSDVHSLTILTHKNRIGGQAIKYSLEDFSGDMFNVRTLSEKILIRRNRSIIVCSSLPFRERASL